MLFGYNSETLFYREENILHTPWHSKQILAVSFSPDGELIACSGQEGNITLWRREDGKLVHVLKGEAQKFCLVWLEASVLLAGSTSGIVFCVIIAKVCSQ